jgi:hypothetical protein
MSPWVQVHQVLWHLTDQSHSLVLCRIEQRQEHYRVYWHRPRMGIAGPFESLDQAIAAAEARLNNPPPRE